MNKITIVLKEKYICWLKPYTISNDEPDYLNFYSQVASQIDTFYNPNKNITITTTNRVVLNTFKKMGMEQERFTSTMNNEIKAALLPQVVYNTWLLQQLQSVNGIVGVEIQRRTLDGWNFYRRIKK